jgi:HD-GYP domain-containing protein (c-di-GMP phosphodiesterase class II)
MEKEDLKEEMQLGDFRILHNYNWFFIGILWAILFLEFKLISFAHAATFAALLLIYTGVHLYNSLMRGEISNNEIVTMSIINVFACVPMLYYAPGFDKDAWLLFVWAGIAVSTFNRMRNIVLLLALFARILVFISFFRGELAQQHQIAIILLKIAMIFFVGLTFATMQKNNYKRTRRIEEVTSVAIVSLAKLTECRDPETGAHLERIKMYTKALARELRNEKNFKSYITDKYVKDLAQSSILHDIGKVGISDGILLKKDVLTPEEREIMKKHSVIGGDALKHAQEQIGGESFLSLAQEIAYHHHERYDGSGYPNGIKGESIPLSARIVSAVDIYDALRNERPYKSAMSHDETMKVMTGEMRHYFDPDVIKVMERMRKELCEIAEINA